MTIEERLLFCTSCEKRKMNRQVGMICSLENQKPQFEDICPDLIKDERESNRKLQQELRASGDIETSTDSSQKYIINSGIAFLLIGVVVIFISLKLGLILISNWTCFYR